MVIIFEDFQTYYLFEKYKKNNSCELEQVDFKIFEFQLSLIYGKISDRLYFWKRS